MEPAAFPLGSATSGKSATGVVSDVCSLAAAPKAPVAELAKAPVVEAPKATVAELAEAPVATPPKAPVVAAPEAPVAELAEAMKV